MSDRTERNVDLQFEVDEEMYSILIELANYMTSGDLDDLINLIIKEWFDKQKTK